MIVLLRIVLRLLADLFAFVALAFRPQRTSAAEILVLRRQLAFSTPLDLDLATLKAFPDAYSATIPPGGGPELTVEDAAKVVLSEGGTCRV